MSLLSLIFGSKPKSASMAKENELRFVFGRRQWSQQICR